ncbi:MAG: 5-oxoprolinase subunit PxpB [Thermoanaerobaculia bacterium]
MSFSPLRAQPLGDSALTIAFGTQKSAELLRRVHAAAISVSAAALPEVDDVVAAYLSLAVFYDSRNTTYSEIAAQVLGVCERASTAGPAPEASRTHEISVTYDGPDLEDVATALGLSTEDVIGRHLARTYSVDLIGFVPGWAYLSELDPALHLPRRAQPRPRVPAGSVAIAGAQTGVYPLVTPGGWHIIGHTDTVMFDPRRDPPAFLRPGDKVRFVGVR